MRVDAKTGQKEEARGSRIGGEPGGTISTSCDGGVGEGSAGITDLTVAADGTVAWIIGSLPYQYYSANPTKVDTYTVCALAARGKTPEVLARDTTVSPGSLAMTGSLVYWTDDGSPRSVRLSVPTKTA